MTHREPVVYNKEMLKNKLGATGIEVTPIGFGTLTIGKSQLNYPIAKGADLIRHALGKGINLIDTAQYYETYGYIREALKGAPSDPVIMSKCLDFSRGAMDYAIEEARRETGRDIIDIFLLHEVKSVPDFLEREGAWNSLMEAKAKGFIKAAGLSTHHVDVAEFCAGLPEIDIVFPLINFKGLGVRRGNVAGTKEDMAKAIKCCSGAGKGVLAMKVFGGGNLTREYIEALDYVSNLSGIDSMVIGFGNRDEVDKAIEYADGIIDTSYHPNTDHKRTRIDPGDCIGCGCCIGRCPNNAIALNKSGVCQIERSVCVNCGYCAPVCPARAIIMF